MPEADDSSLRLPVSPLLLLNHQIQQEAYAFVSTKVRIHCPLPPDLAWLENSISLRQRDFVSEISCFWGFKSHEFSNFKKGVRTNTAHSVLGKMWHIVDTSDKDILSLRVPYSSTEWIVGTCTVVVEDAKAT
jgi:hypothetical protein